MRSFPAIITEGPYMVPHGKIDLCLTSRIFPGGGYGTRHIQQVDVAFSPTVNLLVGIGLSYTGGIGGDVKGVPGDSSLKLKYFIGDFFLNRFSPALLVHFRIPTGVDAYASPEYRSLSYGNHEMKIALTSRFDLSRNNALQFFAGYIFRAEQDENFYSSIWRNPASEGSFFDSKKLKNDCIELSISFNSRSFYPFVPVAEFYHIRRIYRGSIMHDDVEIEGLGAEPLVLAGEIRYYFYPEFFSSIYLVSAPAESGPYPSFSFGIRLQHLL